MVQVLLLVPVKLPGKVANVFKYIAIGLLQRARDDDKSDLPSPGAKAEDQPAGNQQEETGQ